VIQWLRKRFGPTVGAPLITTEDCVYEGLLAGSEILNGCLFADSSGPPVVTFPHHNLESFIEFSIAHAHRPGRSEL